MWDVSSLKLVEFHQKQQQNKLNRIKTNFNNKQQKTEWDAWVGSWIAGEIEDSSVSVSFAVQKHTQHLFIISRVLVANLQTLELNLRFLCEKKNPAFSAGFHNFYFIVYLFTSRC